MFSKPPFFSESQQIKGSALQPKKIMDIHFRMIFFGRMVVRLLFCRTLENSEPENNELAKENYFFKTTSHIIDVFHVNFPGCTVHCTASLAPFPPLPRVPGPIRQQLPPSCHRHRCGERRRHAALGGAATTFTSGAAE